MKNLICLYCFFAVLGTTTMAFGQNQCATIPSLRKLISWANGMSRADFDLEARRLCFSFEEKREEEKKTAFIYTRDIKSKGIIYTESLAYSVFKSDASTTIQFTSSRVDLITFYSTALNSSGYQTIECNIETESNKTAFCYETSRFWVRVIDKKIGQDNIYWIIIFKK